MQLALSRGEADRQTLVWCEGMSQWQALDSVEELQPLLESLPPPLPLEPPPLPPSAAAPAAAAESAGARPGDRPGHGDDGPETDRRQRSGKARAILAGKLDKTVDWLGDKIGNTLWERFGQKALLFLLTPGVVVGAVVTVNHFRPQEPPVLQATGPVATGQVRIDANPWGEIAWIRGPRGRDIALPAARTTPFTLTLPVGAYQAEIEYPHAPASKRCALEVRPDQLTTCWLDLAPVDAQSYFQQIGW